MRGERVQERIAVGRALRRRLGADRAAGTAAVLDDDSLPERLRELRLQDARGDVDRAPRREGHDESNRSCRVLLRERLRSDAGRAPGDEAERRNEPAGLHSCESIVSAPLTSYFPGASLRAHAHVARGEIELEAELLGPFAAAVGEHADLAARLLVAAPGAHHEGVVRRDAPDLVHPFRLELVVVFHVARDVLRRAGRCIRARHGEDRDFLAFGHFRDADVLGIDRAARGLVEFGGFGKLAVGESVADFDGHFGLRELRFLERLASRS